jgi:triacylglycerol lipase
MWVTKLRAGRRIFFDRSSPAHSCLRRRAPALWIVGAKRWEGAEMISRWFRGALVVEAICLLIAIASLLRGRLAPGAALAAAAAILLLDLCVAAAVYAVLRLHAATPPRAGGARTWRCAFVETLALFAVFVVIQPFERWWMGAEAVGPLAPGRTPVLLVHGYLCNRGVWWWLRRRLRARRHAVATVNLEPPLAGIDRLAARLGERIEALLAETGAERVMLVTHSMGALASRAYLRRHGAAHVAGLVTLAAPHHGTQIARLGLGRNAREMEPNSEWLRSLNAEPPPSIPIANLWSLDDELIDPPDASRLANAREIVFKGIGHMAMVFSPTVLACVDAELMRR